MSGGAPARRPPQGHSRGADPRAGGAGRVTESAAVVAAVPPSSPSSPVPAAARRAAAARWPLPPLLAGSAALHAAAAGTALLSPAAWPWALAAVAANHLLITAAGLTPRSALLGPNLTRLPAASAARGDFAITIDDGPDPEVTPALLDLLAAEGVRATFFVIAERAAAQRALLRRIVAAGHSVQNHSLHHRHHFSLLGPRALAREIAGAQARLADLSGQRPHCFRAPAGLRNPFLDPVLHRLDLQLVSWTRRGFDTREADPQRVLARLARQPAGGDILLLHDGHARRTAAGQPVLLAVLPPLLARYRAAGLQPVTLADAVPRRHAPH
ncbi:MAG: polysaccharide deacetylase family protein [Rubrivivax sp.]|nr:polysaccharide deacetylase family protein [Rubrivivax sp.]